MKTIQLPFSLFLGLISFILCENTAWSAPVTASKPVSSTATTNTASTSSNPKAVLWQQVHDLETEEKTAVSSFQGQIDPLKQQIESLRTQISPLEASLHSTKKDFQVKKAALMDQIKPGYLAAYTTQQSALEAAKKTAEQAITAAREVEKTARDAANNTFNTTVKALK